MWCERCVKAWVVQQNARKIGDERFRPTPTQQSETRAGPVRGSAELEFPYKKGQPRDPIPRGAEERTWQEGKKTREEDEGVGKKQKARALNAARVSGRVIREAASFCGRLRQTSGAVNLIPFSWTCQNVLNHMFHHGWITTVAAARVYCPGQFSKDHSSTKPTIFWAPEGKIEPPSNLDADKSPA